MESNQKKNSLRGDRLRSTLRNALHINGLRFDLHHEIPESDTSISRGHRQLRDHLPGWGKLLRATSSAIANRPFVTVSLELLRKPDDNGADIAAGATA